MDFPEIGYDLVLFTTQLDELRIVLYRRIDLL